MKLPDTRFQLQSTRHIIFSLTSIFLTVNSNAFALYNLGQATWLGSDMISVAFVEGALSSRKTAPIYMCCDILICQILCQ